MVVAAVVVVVATVVVTAVGEVVVTADHLLPSHRAKANGLRTVLKLPILV